MEFNKFIEYLFYGLMSSTAVYIASSIGKLKTSVDELNLSFASEIQKLANVKDTIEKHERIIERHSERLIDLEKKSFNCKITNQQYREIL